VPLHVETRVQAGSNPRLLKHSSLSLCLAIATIFALT